MARDLGSEHGIVAALSRSFHLSRCFIAGFGFRRALTEEGGCPDLRSTSDRDEDGSEFVGHRITFVEQFFHPEGWAGAQFPQDITATLVKAGYSVRVVCGSDQYIALRDNPGASRAEELGVSIRRVPQFPFGINWKGGRLVRQLWFCFLALPLILGSRRKPHLYVSQTNPPLIVLVVALASILRKCPFLLIAMDIYPEVVFSHGLIKEESWFGRRLSAFFGWAYRRATRVVSLGPTMSERLLRKGLDKRDIVEISNWSTGTETIVRGPANKLRKKWGLEGKMVFLYSGNLGVAHDVTSPILAMKKLQVSCPDARLMFVGAGARLSEARGLVRKMGLEDLVLFADLVPTELLPHSLGVADVALVTLQPGFGGLVVPSKLLGYMARGIPTLYIGPPSDVSCLLQLSKGGVAFGNGEIDDISRFMRGCIDCPDSLLRMGSKSERYYSRFLSKDQGLDSYKRLIDSLLVPPSVSSNAKAK